MRMLLAALIIATGCVDLTTTGAADTTTTGATDVGEPGWPCLCDLNADGAPDAGTCGTTTVCRSVCPEGASCLAGIPHAPICYRPCVVGDDNPGACECVPIGDSKNGYCFAPPACGV